MSCPAAGADAAVALRRLRIREGARAFLTPMRATLLVRRLALLVAGGCRSVQPTSAPSPQVIAYSPHWDTVGRPWRAFDCPAQPLKLFGFPSARSTDTAAVLRIRIFRHLSAAGDPTLHTVAQALVRLSARYEGPRRTDLPIVPRWGGLVDTTGYIELRGPPGEFGLEIRALCFEWAEGRVRLRAGYRDSVHAHIHAFAIC